MVDDPETIFIVLAQLLFHPAVTGFLYAALLAAIMSTISSQLLVSSSSLTEDFYRLFLRRNASEREAVNVSRVAVALVAAAAMVIARDPESQVLALVANAWAGFGAAFGPLILLALTWGRMTGAGAVAGLGHWRGRGCRVDRTGVECRAARLAWRRPRPLRDRAGLHRGDHCNCGGERPYPPARCRWLRPPYRAISLGAL